MIKKVLLSAICIMVLFMGIGFAEKPFGKNFTRQVAIDKLFVGRTLDPVEGIWYLDKKLEFAIVQKSLITLKEDKERYANCDFIVIRISDGDIYAGLKKADTLNVYNGTGASYIPDVEWRLFSPTMMQIGGPITMEWPNRRLIDSSLNNDFIMRIYPASSY